MFSPLSSPCVQLSSPRCTCGSPALLHIHTYSHPPTNTHTLALHASSLIKTSGAKVSSAPRGRETASSLPFLACFSSIAAAFPFPFSPPLRPRSPRASQAGRGSGGPLTSAPLRRGPALGSPYPQLLLVRSAGREGWRGPADSSQMLAKCSYVITVFSILPPRPLCVSFSPPPLQPQLWPVSDLALPTSLLPPTPHNITICSAQQLIPSGSKVQAFGYCCCYPWQESSCVSRAGKRWAALFCARLLSITAPQLLGTFALPFPSGCKRGEGHLRHRKVTVCFYAAVFWGALRLPCKSSWPSTVLGSLIISGQAAEGVGKTR